MPAARTNNSHLRPKVDLRVEAVKNIGKNHIRVLDAYAGEGIVWKHVENRCPGMTFEYVRIDKKKYDGPETIYGDNLKILPSLDLQSFDLIDLDAYGVPNKQLSIIAEKAPNVPVAVTCIMQSMSPVPRQVLVECGVPEEWTDAKRVSPLVFGRDRIRWWDDFCARLGYTWTWREVYEGGMLKVYQTLHAKKPRVP